MRLAETRPSRPLLAVLLVVITGCAFMILVRTNDRAQSSDLETAAASPSRSATESATASSGSPATGSASDGRPASDGSTDGSAAGSDASEGAAEDAARQTVRVFVSGWLETDPKRRSELLTRSASAELAASLSLTDPAAIPRASLDRLDEVGGSDTSSEFVATLDDGQQIVVTAAADPAYRLGWVVTRVDRWG